MSLINVANLTFSHDGGTRFIFRNASFQLDTDWKLGLIGQNGKGKTTFLKLLCGLHDYSGTIAASVAFQYFPFEVPKGGLPALEIIRQLSPQSEQWEIVRELAWLDVPEKNLARPFSSLSNGERTKVLLAALFLKPGNFLLIDEPTNHLDRHGRKLVSDYLRSKSGFIVVSHDRAFLDSCVDHILSINRQTIEIQQGNYSTWKLNRVRQEQFENNRQKKLKKDVKRLEEAADRATAWAGKTEGDKYKSGSKLELEGWQQAGINRGAIGHKAAKMMKRAKSLEKRRETALEEKAALLADYDKSESLKIWPLRHHSNILAEAVNLELWYEEGKPVAQGIRFCLEQGHRLAVTGKNGSGKSTLLHLLAGLNISHGGFFRLASGLTISEVAQDLSGLQGYLPDYAHKYKLEQNLFRAVLDRLGLSKHFWSELMQNFSDGQKKKVALARSLSQQAHLYIWDEPLNFMDVSAREQIEELLQNFSPTMVFVEHDQAFVDAVATEMLTL